jgi:hypothetical protein
MGDKPAGPVLGLPPGVAPPVPGCAEPELVPEGKAWLMPWVEPRADGSLIVRDCEEAEAERLPGDQRFTVNDVFIDTLEMTNACLAACVEDGACDAPPTSEGWPAWDAPENADYAAGVPFELGEQLCAWRGGRLPSVLELVRASHGDLRHVANPDLYDMVIDCKLSAGDSSECQALRDHSELVSSPIATQPEKPVGTLDADRGPFDHHDLFGGRSEMTAQNGTPGPACDYAYDAADPTSFGPDQIIGDPDARVRFIGGREVWSFEPQVLYPMRNMHVYSSASTLGDGLRCAYDPVYIDESD